ncbi:hypothetical protein QFZ28_001197 [Neobacillus niacini]|uniref:hypothetical protein n=1 Tax=Neobacillus niacini TaxID=86668 RepID=UPI00278AEED6|nr:hypothetical protein [Neobacillus niacini]MDQ1000797.1 hypothetical protein [Neobacillus niacini]
MEQEEFAIKDKRFFVSGLTSLSILSFFLCVLAVTRQFPFYQLSKLISISLIFVFLFSIPFLIKNFIKCNKTVKYLFILNAVCLGLMLIYSIFIQHNNLSLAIRFFIILFLILAAFYLPPKKAYINIFLLLAVLQSVVLIVFEIYLVLFADPAIAAAIRAKVINLQLGDVYTYNQYFYRIQVKGNAILPIAFLVSLFAVQSKRIKISTASLLFVGTVVAGNLAFILAILFFIGMYCLILLFSNKTALAFFKKLFSTRKRIITVSVSLLLIFMIAIAAIYPYLYEVFVRKMIYSIPTRFDQVFHLIGDLTENTKTILFGQGLGNVINVISDYRDYRNNYYFELQSIYILNQVGILYFLLFIVTKIIFAIKFWGNKYIYLLYVSYIVYAFTNPYLFDTTNVLVLIVLSSLRKHYLKTGDLVDK